MQAQPQKLHSKPADHVITAFDFRESIEAIREGFKSADREEGEPVEIVFARLQEKLKAAKLG